MRCRRLLELRSRCEKCKFVLLLSLVSFLAFCSFLLSSQNTANSASNHTSRMRGPASTPPWYSTAAINVTRLPGKEVYLQLAHVLSLEAIRKPCRRLLHIGGKHICTADGQHHVDGEKPVCFDSDVFDISPGSNCLVYTFGVKDDLSFETAMARFDCEVHAFDPTIEQPDPRSLARGLQVHTVGIDGRTWMHRAEETPEQKAHEWPLTTLDDLRKALNQTDRRISYLKLDAEGSEWLALQQQLTEPAGGALSVISQLNVEFHLIFPNGVLTDPGVDNSWQYQLVEENARRFLRTVVALSEAGYDMVWTKRFGLFKGINISDVYETLFVRRDMAQVARMW